jgi:arginase family enzyme
MKYSTARAVYIKLYRYDEFGIIWIDSHASLKQIDHSHIHSFDLFDFISYFVDELVWDDHWLN